MGSKAEITAMLTALLGYSRPKIYFRDYGPEDVEKLVAKTVNNKLKIKLYGPYGDFLLTDLKLMEKVANAAPKAQFHITLKGYIAGCKTKRVGKLDKGKLTVRSAINDADTPQCTMEEYMRYFTDLIPLSEFCRIFEVNATIRDLQDFISMYAEEVLETGLVLSYKKFKKFWSNATTLPESMYEAALVELWCFGIDSPYYYARSLCEDYIVYSVYDPIKRTYKKKSYIEPNHYYDFEFDRFNDDEFDAEGNYIDNGRPDEFDKFDYYDDDFDDDDLDDDDLDDDDLDDDDFDDDDALDDDDLDDDDSDDDDSRGNAFYRDAFDGNEFYEDGIDGDFDI